MRSAGHFQLPDLNRLAPPDRLLFQRYSHSRAGRPAAHGGTLVVRGNDLALTAENLNVIIAMPSISSTLDPAACRRVRTVAVAGERCPQTLAAAAGQCPTRGVHPGRRAPVIACVDGYALGGGCELAMAADFIYATSTAVFGQPEVLLGLIPGFGGCVRLQQLVGPSLARELIYSGRKLEAAHAQRIGLVNEVFDTTPDMREGTDAFLAKRTPVFQRA